MSEPMKMLSFLVLSAIAANPSAANAVNIYTRYFAGVSGGKPCYARYYDLAHLNAHPKQTVRRIVVDFDRTQRDDKVTKNTPADFRAGFGFMLNRSNEWYGQAVGRLGVPVGLVARTSDSDWLFTCVRWGRIPYLADYRSTNTCRSTPRHMTRKDSAGLNVVGSSRFPVIEGQ
jgi:hypothetical protein